MRDYIARPKLGESLISKGNGWLSWEMGQLSWTIGWLNWRKVPKLEGMLKWKVGG
jgi:hypothetical protein